MSICYATLSGYTIVEIIIASLADGSWSPPEQLSLIDCESREVVSAVPHIPCVALSYVWGVEKTDDKNRFPRTIRDAVEVTKRLEYQYLWVDRYCIKQDFTEKPHQISQMDLVYSAAELTIIAAVGINAESGRPGVSMTARNRQQILELDGYRVLECPESPYTAVPRSTWSACAWTLQEAFLSRRRLVFTTDQTCLECAAMNCCESFIEDRKLLYLKDNTRFKRYHHKGIL